MNSIQASSSARLASFINFNKSSSRRGLEVYVGADIYEVKGKEKVDVCIPGSQHLNVVGVDENLWSEKALKDLEALHTKRKAKEALCSIMFCMLALLRAAIRSLESQRRKKLLTSAISNAYKIYNSIQICNPSSWLAKMFVVTLVTFRMVESIR